MNELWQFHWNIWLSRLETQGDSEFLVFLHSNLRSRTRAQVFLTKLKIGTTDEATCTSKQSYLEREIESEIVIEKPVMILHIFKAKYYVPLELINFNC